MGAAATGALWAAAAAVGLACAHPGGATATPAERPKPACASCHEQGPGLRLPIPDLCGACHGTAHGGEVARLLADPPPRGSTSLACLTCHDPHRVHQ